MDVRKLNEALEDTKAALQGRPAKSFIRGANDLLESVKKKLTEGSDGTDSFAHRQVDAVQLPDAPGSVASEAIATKMAADIIADVLTRFPSLKMASGEGGVPSVTTGDGNAVAVTVMGEGSPGHAVHAYSPAGGLFAWRGQAGNTSIQPMVRMEDGLGENGQYNPEWLAHSQNGQALVLNIAHQLGADLAPGQTA